MPIWNADEEAKKITSFVQRLSWSIQSFMVEGMLAIEFALDDQARILKENAQRVEKKLDSIQDDGRRPQLLPRPDGTSVPLYAVSARFDCGPERAACLEETRTDILDRISTWASSQHTPSNNPGPAPDSSHDEPDISWLNGQAGSGKTTIAYTIAERCQEQGILGASFFCSRSDTDCSNPLMIFTTIAYQLGLFHRPHKDLVAQVLQKDPLIVYSSVTRQFEELILQPLTQLRDSFPPCVVVIDALDECRDSQVTSAVLSTLLKHAEDISPLRFFITSRPEQHIVGSFDTPDYRNAFGKLVLHEISLPLVTVDITRYFTATLSDIRRRFNLPESWPEKADIETLSKMANGLFIFAATAVKFIGDRNYNDPVGRLKMLTSPVIPLGSHRLLDWLYLQVLDTAFPEISRGLSGRIKSVLGSIVVAQDPLPIASLASLTGLTSDTAYTSLLGLHSVLVVPSSESNIRIIHPTFAEFLLDSDRCTSRSFVINSRAQHTLLLRGCLGALKELKRDICDIRDPSVLNVEIYDLAMRVERAIPPHLRYSSRHWYTHLVGGEVSDEILDGLLEFSQKDLVHWVEACSLLGVLRDAISGLSESQRKLRDVDDGRARRTVLLLNDCERLIVGYFPAISGSALQLYYLILSLVPKDTTLGQIYAHECLAESSVKVVGGVADSWDACLGTVTAHEGARVRAIDFAPDGRTIVSSGEDGKIRIWDALTCALVLVFSHHSGYVFSVRYSPDGARIASATGDRIVKIWDAVSGVLLRTLEGHTDGVWCAVFTPDGRRIVSGSCDHFIKIWDAETGSCVATLTEHQDSIGSVAVSPDGLWMASGAHDLVCLWSMEAPYIHRVLLKRKRENLFYSVAFTPDSSKVLTASKGAGKVSVWDVKIAERLYNLRPSGQPSPSIRSPSFFPAGDKFAYGSGESVVVLDLAHGETRQSFAGHTDDVTCVTYNRDGTRIASCSYDGTVRLWNATQDAVNMPRHRNTVRSSTPSSKEPVDCRLTVFSQNGSRALLTRDNNSTEVYKTDRWDWAYKPLSLPSECTHYAAFSPDDAVILTASEGKNGEVTLWDAASGSLQVRWKRVVYIMHWAISIQSTLMWSGVLSYMSHCFGGQSSPIMFSPDSRYLLTGTISTASNSGKHTACLWDVATGKLIREFVGHSHDVLSVAFSLDGRRIATGSLDRTVMIWEVATGARVATCSRHGVWVHSVAFSPNGERVVSGGHDHCILTWSAEGGELLQSFEGHTSLVTSVAFTPNGDVVISSSNDNTMRLWDVNTGACLLVLNPDTWGSTVRLSPDGSGILVGDDDRLVQLWAPLDVDAQATTSLPWLPRRTWPVYYIDDGWLFSMMPTRRTRMCWLPVDWRGLAGYDRQNVLFKRQGAQLNFPGLSSYPESPRTDRT
ncbi:uncharacterized protein PHACADRAFT_250587 [Phanerochaete carnosa HHB-10118-sp]|uniref:NACHT domain-containing protein n=1 Tax=Phanerochaete carnosa (strain HHB-10118-sp) TaxID=650164 RepID=K5VAH0_PHACS|nr:uncharacterized protein PHACADRAFT_250587 [Phanerochaete carnosa HHB-10118-sp]EKM59841.1 hypothetical protein PHACADRAFT_250587 [Phanerochaete carnosa HHB-10118-sp]